MTNRGDNSNGQAVSLSKGQLIRLGAETGGLVPVGGPSDGRPARRTKSSGDPMGPRPNSRVTSRQIDIGLVSG